MHVFAVCDAVCDKCLHGVWVCLAAFFDERCVCMHHLIDLSTRFTLTCRHYIVQQVGTSEVEAGRYTKVCMCKRMQSTSDSML